MLSLPEINSIVPRQVAQNKKQVLVSLSKYAAKGAKLDPDNALAVISKDENRISANHDDGVALLHANMSKLEKPYTIFMRLDKAVDFGNTEDTDVDLVFLMLSPEKDGALHLHRLSALSRLLRNKDIVSFLRHTEDSEALYALLTDPQRLRFAA